MAEGGGVSPEVIYVGRAEGAGPVERVKRGFVDFLKSQAPGEHARRTMERYDWLKDKLDGRSRELLVKLRPAAEKAAAMAGITTTALELYLAASVGIGAAILAGGKAKDLLLNPEHRKRAWDASAGVAKKVGNEAAGIIRKAYVRAKVIVEAGIAAWAGGAAVDKLRRKPQRPEPPPRPAPQKETISHEGGPAVRTLFESVIARSDLALATESGDTSVRVGLFDGATKASARLAAEVVRDNTGTAVYLTYLGPGAQAITAVSGSIDSRTNEMRFGTDIEKRTFSSGTAPEAVINAFIERRRQAAWQKSTPVSRVGQGTPQDVAGMQEFLAKEAVLNEEATAAWAQRLKPKQ